MNKHDLVKLNQFNRTEALLSNIPFSMVILDEGITTIDRVNGKLRFCTKWKYKPYATFNGVRMIYFK